VVDGGPDLERRRWAVPPGRGLIKGVDLALLDPGDPDDRHLLILAEHTELLEAIEEGRDEVEVGGLRFSPQMHLALHEIVATQLFDDEPPETWQTARRLTASGYERHEALHMLGSVVAKEIFEALQRGRAYDQERYRVALEALPGSCDRWRWR
jgi:hypothetical protein